LEAGLRSVSSDRLTHLHVGKARWLVFFAGRPRFDFIWCTVLRLVSRLSAQKTV